MYICFLILQPSLRRFKVLVGKTPHQHGSHNTPQFPQIRTSHVVFLPPLYCSVYPEGFLYQHPTSPQSSRLWRKTKTLKLAAVRHSECTQPCAAYGLLFCRCISGGEYGDVSIVQNAVVRSRVFPRQGRDLTGKDLKPEANRYIVQEALFVG